MTLALTTAPSLYEQRAKPLRRFMDSEAALSKTMPVRAIAFKRHDRLSFVHYSLWRIHSGCVRTLTWNAEGEFVPLGFWSTGDVVGYPIAQTYPYEAECLTAVEAEHLSVSHPLSREMVLNQIRQSTCLLRIAHCRNSEQRVLQFVCWLAEHFGKSNVEDSIGNGVKGVHVLLRLTHQEIAESIGTTRVTVTRLLKSLERKGHIIWKPNEKIVFQQTLDRCYMNPSKKP